MPLLDTGYHHYDGSYRGVWYRRGVIAWSGMSRVLANKWVRFFVGMPWLICLLMVSVLFFIGQLLVPDSLAFDLLGMMGRNEQGFFGAITAWLKDHPDISVHTVYNFLFFQYAKWSSVFGFVIIAMTVPQLVTVDLSSRALLVYSSKALNRFDYLLGKFGIAFGMLTCVWLGPLLIAWFLGNLLSPDWTFFVHSSRALTNVLAYVVTSMVIMSVVALGISALSSKERSTTSMWICLWFVGIMFGEIGSFTRPWLQKLSLTHNLNQVAVYSFDLKKDMQTAGEVIPSIGKAMKRLERRGFRRNPITRDLVLDPQMEGALVGLILMVGVSSLIIARKVRPEAT